MYRAAYYGYKRSYVILLSKLKCFDGIKIIAELQQFKLLAVNV